MSDQRKAAARAVFEVWNSGELARLDALVAPDVVHHDPYDPNGRDGLEGMKRTIRLNRDLFPDLHIAVQDQVAERDRVATRWTGSMTHAPTGKAVMITGITIDRFENGRIIEAWRSMDMLAMLRGIGAIAKS